MSILKYNFLLLILLSLFFLCKGDGDIAEQTCSFYIDCNDCDFCGEESEIYSNCNYDNIFCKGDNNQYFYSPRLKSEYDAFFRKDEEVNNFCGKSEIEYNLQKEPVLILEVNKSNFPKGKLVHCSFIFNHLEKYKKYEPALMLEFNKNGNNINNIKFKIIIELTSIDEKKTQKLITNDNLKENNIFEEVLKNTEELLIFVDFLNNGIENDETLEIKYRITKNSYLLNLTSYIIYGILGLICIIIIIIILIKIKCPEYLTFNKTREENQRIPRYSRRASTNLNRNSVENVIVSNREVKKEVKKKINYICLKVLKNEIFSNDLRQKYGENCSICLEKFEEGQTTISITPCEHIFHFECIKKWIESNGFTPYCPNCKYYFIKKNDENNNPSVMLIRRNINNNNNNNNYNNNNINNLNTNRHIVSNENNTSHLTV